MFPLPTDRMYLASSFVWGMLFHMMAIVSMLYMVDMAGLDALELVLVGTALELSAFIFEVPTGLVADSYSRRLSVIIGFAVTGFAFVVMAAAPVFWVIALGSFIWGLGYTFISGAQQAWLADEVGVSRAGPLYLVGEKLSSYGSFVGIAIAVPVGLLQVNYPIILAGLLFIVWAVVAWFGMAETNFRPSREHGTYGQLLATLTDGVRIVRRSRVLVMLMAIGVVIGAFSEGYDRLSLAHLMRGFEFPSPWGAAPVVVFGAIGVLGNVASIILVNIALPRIDTDQPRQIANALSLATAAIIGVALVFALTGNVWLAIAMNVAMAPLRRIVHPLTVSWMNRHIEPRVRATVISMHSQSDAIGQMAGGPAVGVVGREFGLPVALTISALLLTPAVWLYRRNQDSVIRTHS